MNATAAEVNTFYMSMKADLNAVLPAALAMPAKGEEFMERSRVINGHELLFWQLACLMVHWQQHSSGRGHATLKSSTNGANSFYVRCSMMQASLFWTMQLSTNQKQLVNSLKIKVQSYSFYLLIHRTLIQSNMILEPSRKSENITIRNPLRISSKRISDFGLSYIRSLVLQVGKHTLHNPGLKSVHI